MSVQGNYKNPCRLIRGNRNGEKCERLMSQLPSRSFADLLGKRTIILGDVRSGKTRLTASLLREAMVLGFAAEITVIDMAPKSTFLKGLRIGGRLFEPSKRPKGVGYLAPRRVETPRLTARDGNELLRLVEVNRKRIYPILKSYISRPTPILFANDISLYLQSGDLRTLHDMTQAASTFVGNGYYGNTLANDFATGISGTERGLMDQLAAAMDFKIILTTEPPEQPTVATRVGNRTMQKSRLQPMKYTLLEALLTSLRKQSKAGALGVC